MSGFKVMNNYEQLLANRVEITRLFQERVESSSACKGEPQFAGVWMAISEEDKPIEDYETALLAVYEKYDFGTRYTDKQLISVLSKQKTGLKKLAAIPLFKRGANYRAIVV